MAKWLMYLSVPVYDYNEQYTCIITSLKFAEHVSDAQQTFSVSKCCFCEKNIRS